MIQTEWALEETRPLRTQAGLHSPSPPPQVLLCTGLEGTIHKACSALGPGCLEEEGVLEQEAAIQCTGFSPSLQGDIALLPLSHGDIHSGVVLPRVEQ